MRLRTRSPHESIEPERPSGEPRKGILICPECGHESHADGDWVRDDSGGRRRYGCPDCGAVVVSQPTFVRANTE